ncbi:MAG TPA: iron-sulfur cluster assembly accessory protein [Polyangiales bacterium]
MIQLTENAAGAIRSAIEDADGPVEGLRIMVESGGCSGFKYMLGLVAEKEPDDIIVERHGIQVFIDAKSTPLLNGVTVDFCETLQGAGFTFDNPNATSSCACGKSFC